MNLQFTEKKEPEMIFGMPANEYFAAEAMNQSSLKKLRDCPLKFKFELENPRNHESAAMAMGTLVHTALLEPEQMSEYRVLDDYTKKGLLEKAQWSGSKAKEFSKRLGSFQEWAKEGPLADESDMATALEIARAVSKLPVGKQLETAETEVSVFATYEAAEGPIRIKGRIDALMRDEKLIIDVKTTRPGGGSAMAFGKTAWNFGYLQQAGYYKLLCELAGVTINRFAILCVETEAPYCPVVYQIPPEGLRWAYHESMQLLDRLSRCMAAKDWPGYENQIISLPGFAQAEIEEDLTCLPDDENE